MEKIEMDKNHPCLICKKPVKDGAGIACREHQEEAANVIDVFNTEIMDAGVPLLETFT